MTDRELMQQALYVFDLFYESGFDREDCFAVIKALRERLAQLEQEPVPWESFFKRYCPWLEQPALQPEQDVPEASCGNMVPVGWLESPDGVFRANPLYKIKFPSKLLSWQVPLYKAQPEQEPVAIALNTGTKQGVKWLKNVEHGERLYTTPPQRKPLTDNELADLWYKQSLDWMEFARAIEAAHGIKEST